MRLIDADNFLKNLRYYLDRNFIGEISSQSTITIGELASLIKDEPTAYNIDIVTEELSEAIGKGNNMFTKGYKSALEDIRYYKKPISHIRVK